MCPCRLGFERGALNVHVQVQPADRQNASAEFLAQQLHEHTAGLADSNPVQEFCPRLHSKRWQVRARTDANLAVAMTQAVPVPAHSVRGDVELHAGDGHRLRAARGFCLCPCCCEALHERLR